MAVTVTKIRKKKDFDAIFSTGRSLKGEGLVIRYAKNKDGENRIAFMVSHKVSKKAVVRNKLRRRLQEIYKTVSLPKSTDLVMIALPGVEKKEFSELEELVHRLLNKLS